MSARWPTPSPTAARCSAVIAAEDPSIRRQRGGMPPPVDYTAALGKSIKGLRIAVVHEGFGQTAESWAVSACRRAIRVDRKVKAAVHQSRQAAAPW